MKVLVTVVYAKEGVAEGTLGVYPPKVEIIEAKDAVDLRSRLDFFLAGCVLKPGSITSHAVTLLP